VVDHPAGGDSLGEGRQAADVVGVEVREQEVVDAVDARVVHGRLNAQRVAGHNAFPSR